MTSSPIATPNRSSGRLLSLLGLGLAVLGVIGYVVQLSLQRLMFPWYMPALALLGVVLVVLSLWQRRTLWRGLALLAVVLLAGAELAGLYAVRLPPYEGPLAIGRPIPAFAAKQADGTPFTHDNLTGAQHHVLVFFRGRW
jgi:hypothetical protein